MAHNISGFDNHLILPKIAGKVLRVQLFMCWWKYWKVYLFCLEKLLKKKNPNVNVKIAKNCQINVKNVTKYMKTVIVILNT